MHKLESSTEQTRDLVVEEIDSQLGERIVPKHHTKIALTTMLMALLAAFGALMAGISAQEALIDRTAEIIDVNVKESDRLAIDILKAKHEILISLGEKPDPIEVEQIAKYTREATIRAQKAMAEENIVQSLALPHLIFAVSVTLLSVGIALNGIAMVMDHRMLWLIGVILGILGVIGLVGGVLLMAAS